MERWRRIDAASPDDARTLLRTCCGAEAWVERMMARRPFRDRDTVVAAARDEWFALTADDWRQAFTHHPRIGDRDAMRAKLTAGLTLSAREQAGVDDASEEVLTALVLANHAYELRFGYLFIVCASGKSAGEMLGILRERLSNDAETEIRIAAGEHAKICELRLLAET